MPLLKKRLNRGQVKKNGEKKNGERENEEKEDENESDNEDQAEESLEPAVFVGKKAKIKLKNLQ